MDDATAAKVVQPSQGVHLVFERSFLPGNSAIMVPHTDDGRVLFVIPWHNRVLVGTTDTPMQEAEIEPRPLREEIDFILRNAARYLARAPSDKDVLSVFAGQRPLVRPPREDGAPTKTISRNHEILISDAGLITIVGGKWTTYRKMAEDTMDHAILIGNLPDRPCQTANLHLHGWQCAAETSTLPDYLAVYGTDAERLQTLIKADPALGEPLHPSLPYARASVIWAARMEMAQTVEDVLARRTRALLLNAQAAMECAPITAHLLAAELGKPAEWQKQQIEEFTTLAGQYLINESASQNLPN